MQSIHLLFMSILTACGEKTEDTSSSDTGDTPGIINTEASYLYECYSDDEWCELNSSTATLDTETFQAYLSVDGQISEESCSTLCYEETGAYYDYLCSCDYTGADTDGNHPVTCEYTTCAVEGRGHGNIEKLTCATGTSELHRYFVRAYHAEASSVAAFVQLRTELQQHNAPRTLLKRCMDAAIDEVHHARMMAKLVRDAQEELPALNFGTKQERTLFALALDNAVEGCVFESYSALKAHYQARNSKDKRIRAVMKVIAPDETRHAQLAWDIHHFLMTQLSEIEQQQIQNAQRQATQKIIAQAKSDLEQAEGVMALPPIVLAEQFAAQIVA